MHSRTLTCAAVGLALIVAATARGQDVDKRVQELEARRIAAIEKVRPSVVAIFNQDRRGGGSGVLISDDGYALTNVHVVAGLGPMGAFSPTFQCGLPDGVLYDAVVVGMDKVGDVALIKLLPKKEGAKFPFSALGDSDKVQQGDWSLAMGNPFLFANDFTPTVTFGMVSGVHRYQYPAGLTLEYTDCIQVDTSINPGNSGGPLFNLDGELIGINGRISLEKRGRVNIGVGYAISINQIKNFMGHLRAGLDCDHASMGALLGSEAEEEGLPGVRLLVRNILPQSDAARRGLDLRDEVISFAGRPMTSVNQFKNILGIFPRGWRVPITFRHEEEKDGKREEYKKSTLVRLMGHIRQEVKDPNAKDDEPKPQPGAPRIVPGSGPAAKLYEAKPGYANWYFNKLERDRLLAALKKQSDLAGTQKEWLLEAAGEVKGKNATAMVKISEEGGKDLVEATIGGVEYKLEPLKPGLSKDDLREPRASGGMLLALYHYQRLLAVGEKAFTGNFSHGGYEPFYPPPLDDTKVDWAKQRVDCEVLRTEQAGTALKWYFAQKDQALLGVEMMLPPDEKTAEEGEDPCEVYFSDYKAVDGKMMPHRIEVRYAGEVGKDSERYCLLTVKSWKFAAAK
jgi:serine protease Do